MGPPTKDRAQIRHNRIVQKQHVQSLQRRTQKQNENRHCNKFEPVFGPDLSGLSIQKIDNTTHIVNETNFDARHDDRQDRCPDEQAIERLGIIQKERQ